MFCSSNQAVKKATAERRGASWVGIDSGEVSTRIARWKTGQLGLLCANRMLWEGFDEPRCTAVWIDRDTESEIALVQMAGRALGYQPGKTARIYSRTTEQRLRLAAALLRLNLPRNQLTDGEMIRESKRQRKWIAQLVPLPRNTYIIFQLRRN